MAAELAALLIKSNPPASTSECCRIINTLLDNLARDDCEKHRRINLRNNKIKSAIVSVKYAVDFLLASGFESVDEGLIEMRGDHASTRATAAQAALDLACVQNDGPLALGLQLPLEGVRSCCAVGETAIVTGSIDNGVRIWPVSRPLVGQSQPLVCLQEHEGVRGVNGVLSLLELPDRRVASCARDGKMLLWELSATGGKLAATLEAHGDEQGKDVTNKRTVACLAHDRMTIFSGGWDWTIRVWTEPHTPDAKPSTLCGHEAAVLTLAVLADHRLASGSGDGTVRLWSRLETDGEYHCVAVCQAGSVVRGLAATEDGGFAQVGNDGVLRLWSASAELSARSSSVGSYLFCVAVAGE